MSLDHSPDVQVSGTARMPLQLEYPDNEVRVGPRPEVPRSNILCVDSVPDFARH